MEHYDDEQLNTLVSAIQTIKALQSMLFRMRISLNRQSTILKKRQATRLRVRAYRRRRDGQIAKRPQRDQRQGR
jgi:hypothetical protein